MQDTQPSKNKIYYDSTSKLYHLNYEFLTKPSQFIAIDPIYGRHFIYNNDDKILIFSHNPVQKPYNDKSKPLIEINLEDKYEEGELRKPRIDPTLHIINDKKGNCALLVIGGYIVEDNG